MNSQKMTQSTIEKWVDLAQEGDEESFVNLYNLFFDSIFRYVSFRVRSDQVEDLVGDIFYKVINNLSKYKKKSGATFKTWLYRIAHNQVVDFYRKQKELLGVDGLDENFFINLPDEDRPSPSASVIEKEKIEQVHTILKKLSPVHREILELKFLEGFSNIEISQITGKTEGNIRIMQLRALREMRKYF